MQRAIHARPGRHSDRQICHGGLQPHQSSERHRHRNVESVGYTDSARQIRCADSSACTATHSKSCGADNRKSTSVFRINLSHVGELAWAFCDAGIGARYAHSKTSAAGRKSLVEGFRAGEYPILVNFGPLPLPPRPKPSTSTRNWFNLRSPPSLPPGLLLLIATFRWPRFCQQRYKSDSPPHRRRD